MTASTASGPRTGAARRAYLDPEVRARVSMLANTDSESLRAGLHRLADDLRTRRWHNAHADLLHLDALDVGYCIITVDLPAPE